MKRRALYFFTRDDEEDVSRTLREAFPSLKFIDDQRWPTPFPPMADGIHRCRSNLVYLWHSDLTARLPYLRLSEAEYQGPATGPVIQFCRCRQRDGQLAVAQLSAFIEDPASPLGRAHAKLIALLKKRYACPLDCYDARTGDLLTARVGGYLIGPSIRKDPASAPRLVPAFGRDEYMVPAKKMPNPPMQRTGGGGNLEE